MNNPPPIDNRFVEPGCEQFSSKPPASIADELDQLRTQLKSVEAERDEAKRLLSESKDALHEVAAFGSCDCNIPKGVTCVPCECAMICNQIHTFLNPKPQDVKP